MKKGIKSLLIAVAFAFMATSTFTSCSDDVVHEHYYQGSEIYNYYPVVYNINSSSSQKWVWDANYERYECVVPLGDIDKAVYEKGVVTASLFLTEYEGEESLKNLPFVHTYYNDQYPSVPYYTETISYDISYNPAVIRFYIQTSDPDLFPGFTQEYEFKVSIVWDPLS